MFGVVEIKSWRFHFCGLSMVSLFWWFPTFFFAVANMRAGLNLPQWNPRTVPSNAVHRPVAIPAARYTFDSKSIHWWHSSHFVSFFTFDMFLNSYFRMLLFLYMQCASFVSIKLVWSCSFLPRTMLKCFSWLSDHVTHVFRRRLDLHKMTPKTKRMKSLSTSWSAFRLGPEMGRNGSAVMEIYTEVEKYVH